MNIAPIEEDTKGKIVVDGSIAIDTIGLVKEDVNMEVERGEVTTIESKRYNYVLGGYLNKCKNARIIGELGFGMNRKAILTGSMLEDEGTYRTVHFGIGSNSTIGGKNKANSHIDVIIKDPKIEIDGKRIDIWELT